MQRFAADVVTGYRDDLRAMADGIPTAEAAVDKFTDQQVIEAMENIMAVATGVEDNSYPDNVVDLLTHKNPPPQGRGAMG